MTVTAPAVIDGEFYGKELAHPTPEPAAATQDRPTRLTGPANVSGAKVLAAITLILAFAAVLGFVLGLKHWPLG